MVKGLGFRNIKRTGMFNFFVYWFLSAFYHSLTTSNLFLASFNNFSGITEEFPETFQKLPETTE